MTIIIHFIWYFKAFIFYHFPTVRIWQCIIKHGCESNTSIEEIPKEAFSCEVSCCFSLLTQFVYIRSKLSDILLKICLNIFLHLHFNGVNEDAVYIKLWTIYIYIYILNWYPLSWRLHLRLWQCTMICFDRALHWGIDCYLLLVG